MNQLSLFFPDEIVEIKEGKVCTKCNTYLPLSKFGIHSGANFLRAECKSCSTRLSKVRKELREIHGMPPEGYTCPICNGDAEAVKGKGGALNGSWAVDHCHDTDAFRGWLCHKCNRAIGNFDDDIKKLERAIEYLENHLRKTFLV